MNAEKIDLLLSRAKSLAQIGDWRQAYSLLRGNYKWVVASIEEDMGSLYRLLRYTQALCFAARGAKLKPQTT